MRKFSVETISILVAMLITVIVMLFNIYNTNTVLEASKKITNIEKIVTENRTLILQNKELIDKNKELIYSNAMLIKIKTDK